jgi:hypothetical protein
MIPLLCGMLLWGAGVWAQQPLLKLVAERDSLGVGDTLEVRVLVEALDQRLSSAGAVVALARGIFVPLSDTPFAAGDFLPGQPYDNAAVEAGGELRLSYVAVSGTAEEGERLAATGEGELARFWLRAVAPTAGIALRLEGAGLYRSMYTAPDQPGVEQRFSLPEQPLQVRVGGQAALVQPIAVSPPSSPEILPTEPVQSEAPSLSPPPNTPPQVLAPTGLAVAVGAESDGPLLAGFLRDAEDPFEVLQVEVAGDAQVAARIEDGRLVVRGLQAGPGLVEIRVGDREGAWASAQVEVWVRAVGQGPLLRALPKVALRVGGEKTLDLSSYVYDPDTPLAALSWSLAPEGGVEADIAGATLTLRGVAVGPARLGLQVADTEGNMAMAALALQVEEPLPQAALPPVPVDPAPTTPITEIDSPSTQDSTPEALPRAAEPSQESALPDSASAPDHSEVAAPPEPTQADTGGVATGAEEDQISAVDSVQASPDSMAMPEPSPEPEAEEGVQADSPAAPPPVSVEEVVQADSAAAPLPAPVEEVQTSDTPAAPFAPIVEASSSAVPLPVAVPTAAPLSADTLQLIRLEVAPSVEHQMVAGRIDSGLVADAWIRQGEPGQVQWSLRGGKGLVAWLDPGTRRLYLDARQALPGRRVFFAEAVLGAERRQVTLGVEVRVPRLALLTFPVLELGEGQQLALALDSYVEGDFAPEELRWEVEAPQGTGVELDGEGRVLRLKGVGGFSLRLQVSSPWGNKAEALLQVGGISAPAIPDSAAGPILIPVAADPSPAPPAVSPLPLSPEPSAPPAAEPMAPADEHPPLLQLEAVALETGVELWVRADEALRAPPLVRVNGQVLAVQGAGGEYRALWADQDSELQVRVEGEDLAGNTGQAGLSLGAGQVRPGAARLRSPDGRWQLHFPQVQAPAWVLLRAAGEAQHLGFDAGRTGPVELVAAYEGKAPAILRQQGEEWEALPTYVLAGGQQVFARSERAGAFKLGGRAAQALPIQPLVYPNPFNAQAAIRYQVATRGAVQVRVRDSQGRTLRQLVDQVQEPGLWTAPWDGQDGAGQGAASGVYFYEVESAGQRWTGKLLLLR